MKRFIFLLLFFSAITHAVEPGQVLIGTGMRLVPLAGVAPTNCTAAASRVCLWYDSNTNQFNLHLIGGTDTLVLDGSEAQTITGIKTFAVGADFVFAKQGDHVIRVMPSTASGAAGGVLTTSGGDGAPGDGVNPGGAAGNSVYTGGAGGAASATQGSAPGGSARLVGGNGGAGSAAQPAGQGAITFVTGGAAGANNGGGGANGGDVIVNGGPRTGGGTVGNVKIGNTGNTQEVQIGNANIQTTVTGREAINQGTTTVVPLTVQGIASSTVPLAVIKQGVTPGANADPLQIQDSTAAVLAKVDNAGNIAGQNVLGTGFQLTPLAAAPSVCTAVLGRVCFWYSNVSNQFNLRLADGTDTGILDISEAQTITGLKTFATPFAFIQGATAAVQINQSTTPGASGGILALLAGTAADADATHVGGSGGTFLGIGGAGGNASAAHVAGQGGAGAVEGASGGDGTLTQAAGAGGPAAVQAGSAGVDNGGGGNSGGDVTIYAGVGSGAGITGRVLIGTGGYSSDISLGWPGLLTMYLTALAWTLQTNQLLYQQFDGQNIPMVHLRQGVLSGANADFLICNTTGDGSTVCKIDKLGNIYSVGLNVPTTHNSPGTPQTMEYGTIANGGTVQQTVTFGTAFGANPVCTCSNNSAAANGARCTPGGAGANVVLATLNVGNTDAVSYICIGNR